VYRWTHGENDRDTGDRHDRAPVAHGVPAGGAGTEDPLDPDVEAEAPALGHDRFTKLFFVSRAVHISTSAAMPVR
jgi:hypothetical protein